MSTPELHLQTLFRLDGDGRIRKIREPELSPAPLFTFVRGRESCAWAIRADVPQEVADELDRLAREEPPGSDFQRAPMHAQRYASLLKGSVYSGPAFSFPDEIAQPQGTVFIEDVEMLDHHFSGWEASEIPYRTPIVALVEDGYAVSVCCCARRSEEAAEAGLETAVGYRGRGLGPRVTAAWALAVRASGRTPLYSTSWCNEASLAVARKLGLVTYASTWRVSESQQEG